MNTTPHDQAHVALLDSAESILRGNEPRGPLAAIADPRRRLTLASSLTLRDPGEPLSNWWLRHFTATGRPVDEAEIGITLASLERCRCGVPMREHEDDPDLTDLPLCWHEYTELFDLPGESRRRRLAAVRRFPDASFLAVRTAHSEAPRSRRQAAWAALDAVDRGIEPTAALAAFLRLDAGDLEETQRWGRLRGFVRRERLDYGKARRLFRATARLLEAHCTTRGIRYAQRWLPLLDAIAQAAHLEPDLVLRLHVDGCGMDELASTRPSHFPLRATIRQLRERRYAILLQQSEPLRTSGFGIAGAPRIDTILPCRWSARSLDTPLELCVEGLEMRHPIAKLARHVVYNKAQVVSLRSADGHERATLTLVPPLHATAHRTHARTLRIEGPGSDPVHPTALLATGELLHHWHSVHEVMLGTT